MTTPTMEQTTGTFFGSKTSSLDDFAKEFDAGTKIGSTEGGVKSLLNSATLPRCTLPTHTPHPVCNDEEQNSELFSDEEEHGTSLHDSGIGLGRGICTNNDASTDEEEEEEEEEEESEEGPGSAATGYVRQILHPTDFGPVVQHEANEPESDESDHEVAEVRFEPEPMRRAFYVPSTLDQLLDMEPLFVQREAAPFPPFMTCESEDDVINSDSRLYGLVRPCRCGAEEEPRLQLWYIDAHGNVTPHAP